MVPESAAKFETSLAVAFALASVTFTSSPVAKSVITSLPEATVNTSSPVPPVKLSSPSPPLIASFWAPPLIISFPPAPVIISTPSDPVILSTCASPWMVKPSDCPPKFTVEPLVASVLIISTVAILLSVEKV